MNAKFIDDWKLPQRDSTYGSMPGNGLGMRVILPRPAASSASAPIRRRTSGGSRLGRPVAASTNTHSVRPRAITAGSPLRVNS